MKHSQAEYKYAIAGLKAVNKVLDTFLERGEAIVHRNMWQVSPGIWISNDFNTFDEAIQWLWKLIL